ncbi:hypothetical protein NIIDMKKI_13510 [Mycobacterium kansasii]|uniref:PE domain-containing protein n=1 Tax=Mycobacterium kansasii TaxID=1768 RepID=A0A7G1I8M3_MYCKA|nr:hypothetical protein NIIDMKKI_13510 [Mycobacterium kansasii]
MPWTPRVRHSGGAFGKKRKMSFPAAIRSNFRSLPVVDVIQVRRLGAAMSFVIASSEMMAAAATDLAGIGSSISAANAAAAAPTAGVVVAAADEVSAGVAALFSAYAQAYQKLGTQVAGFHAQLVQALTAGAGAYASTEAANVEQTLLNAINAPTQAFLGRPLIGNGANGGPGQPGVLVGCCWVTAVTAETAGPTSLAAPVGALA